MESKYISYTYFPLHSRWFQNKLQFSINISVFTSKDKLSFKKYFKIKQNQDLQQWYQSPSSLCMLIMSYIFCIPICF